MCKCYIASADLQSKTGPPGPTRQRGLLAEYSIVIPQGINRLKKEMPRVLEDGENGMTPFSRELFLHLFQQLLNLEVRMKEYDQRIQRVYNQ